MRSFYIGGKMDIDELITKAESGDPIAQYELSIKYSDGDGIEKNQSPLLG